MVRDLTRNLLSLPWTIPAPRDLARLPLELARRWSEGMRLVASGGALDGLREVVNRSQVFLLVLAGGELVGAPSTGPFPLRELVERAYALDPFPTLWVVEGLGHDYVERVWEQGAVPHHLLNGEAARGLPEKSLLMLHAGVGLGIAQHLLDDFRSGSSQTTLRSLVAEIVTLCRESSREGYVGAALESLGLVTRTFHPGLVSDVDQALRQVFPEVTGFYWHGVGRAIYFLALNFLPCSDWQTFEMAKREAPDELSRLNAFAGLAWAFTLVNQRQPRVLAEVLLRRHGRELSRDGAFANGVASSVIMRFDTTPEAPFIASFCNWQPDPPDRELAGVWDALVRIPCQEALGRFYPRLKAENRLDEVFRYHSLPALVRSLPEGGVP